MAKNQKNIIDYFWDESDASKQIFKALNIMKNALSKINEEMGKNINTHKSAIDDYASEIQKFEKTLNAKMKQLDAELSTDKVAVLKAQIVKELSNTQQSFAKSINDKFAELEDKIPTESTVTEIVKEKAVTDPAEDIRTKLEFLEGDERLDISAIKGVDDLVKEINDRIEAVKNGVNRGTGPRGMQLFIDGVKKGLIANLDLRAGPGVALAYSKVNGLDTITINVTGGGGSGITVETPPETPNASNQVFTVSKQPKWVVADGVTYYEGAGYSYASLQVTMDIPPSSTIRAIT